MAPPRPVFRAGDPRRARIRDNHLHRRLPDVRPRANGGEDAAADARRHAHGVEHLCGVLPGRAARRLRVRAPAATPGDRPRRDRAAGSGCPRWRDPADRNPPPAAGHGSRHDMAAPAAPVLARARFLRAGRCRTVAADVVLTHRRRRRRQSVCALRCQQRGKLRGAARVPRARRADVHTGQPEVALGDRLFAAGRQPRAVRLAGCSRHVQPIRPCCRSDWGRGRCPDGTRPRRVVRVGVRSVQRDAGRHHVHLDRRGSGSAPVDRAADRLPADVRARLQRTRRAAHAGGVATPGAAAECGAVPDDRRNRFPDRPDGGAAPHHLLCRGDDMPRDAREPPAARGAPDRVLPLDRRRRGRRRALQRAARAGAVRDRGRVPIHAPVRGGGAGLRGPPAPHRERRPSHRARCRRARRRRRCRPDGSRALPVSSRGDGARRRRRHPRRVLPQAVASRVRERTRRALPCLVGAANPGCTDARNQPDVLRHLPRDRRRTRLSLAVSRLHAARYAGCPVRPPTSR